MFKKINVFCSLKVLTNFHQQSISLLKFFYALELEAEDTDNLLQSLEPENKDVAEALGSKQARERHHKIDKLGKRSPHRRQSFPE